MRCYDVRVTRQAFRYDGACDRSLFPVSRVRCIRSLCITCLVLSSAVSPRAHIPRDRRSAHTDTGQPIVQHLAGTDGQDEAGDIFVPDEGVNLTTAIRMHTIHGAFASFEKEFKGSREVGKAADLFVLDEDLRQVAVESLREVGVVMTAIGGEVVYEA
jgi:hypothetical protein